MPLTWKTSRRELVLDVPRIVGILNTTPDSFSDGGRFDTVDAALRRAEQMIAEGAGVIDVGGESTRPGSHAVAAVDEIERVVPVIAALTSRFDVPVSIDTRKADVAAAAIDAGAEIVNDISGLRWDERLARVAAETGAGIVLMHSRGEFETMHSEPPVEDIMSDVISDLRRSSEKAIAAGVAPECIALDVGIGFGKTQEQNLQLLGKLRSLAEEFPDLPIYVGASRKSFIAKASAGEPPEERMPGSLAAAVIAVLNGAVILRVHDVRETVQAVRVAAAVRNA